MSTILLINNGSETIELYKAILSSYNLEIVSWKELPILDIREYTLILLSDGKDINIRENLLLQELLTKSDQPIIGICYGFQAIAYTFGCIIEKLNERSSGIKLISVLENLTFIRNVKQFYAIEKHSYSIKKLSTLIDGIAVSNDGFEIIKVKDRDIYGFQYHPEIIVNGVSELSTKIFKNLIKSFVNKKVKAL